LADELKRRLEPSPYEVGRARRRQEKLDKEAALVAAWEAREKFAEQDMARALSGVATPLMEELTRQRDTSALIGVCQTDHVYDVVLLRYGVPKDEEIWKLGIQESRYCWVRGAGVMVQGTATMGLSNARLEVVTLSLGRVLSALKSQIFLPHLELLSSLPRIDETELKSIFGPGFIFDEETYDERRFAADALVARCLPPDGQP
jgi:hypothetical protein